MFKSFRLHVLLSVFKVSCLIRVIKIARVGTGSTVAPAPYKINLCCVKLREKCLRGSVRIRCAARCRLTAASARVFAAMLVIRTCTALERARGVASSQP